VLLPCLLCRAASPSARPSTKRPWLPCKRISQRATPDLRQGLNPARGRRPGHPAPAGSLIALRRRCNRGPRPGGCCPGTVRPTEQLPRHHRPHRQVRSRNLRRGRHRGTTKKAACSRAGGQLADAYRRDVTLLVESSGWRGVSWCSGRGRQQEPDPDGRRDSPGRVASAGLVGKLAQALGRVRGHRELGPKARWSPGRCGRRYRPQLVYKPR